MMNGSTLHINHAQLVLEETPERMIAELEPNLDYANWAGWTGVSTA